MPWNNGSLWAYSGARADSTREAASAAVTISRMVENLSLGISPPGEQQGLGCTVTIPPAASHRAGGTVVRRAP